MPLAFSKSNESLKWLVLIAFSYFEDSKLLATMSHCALLYKQHIKIQPLTLPS